MKPTVAIYTRLSLAVGEQTATARQEKACRLFAAAREWRVGPVFEDVDVSAFQAGIRRPKFEQMIEAVIAGKLSGVLVWKLDRLVRRPADFERFWAACETAGVFLASVTEPLDSSTPLGLALVRILVTFAGLEQSVRSERLKAKWRDQAERGQPFPNGFRAYGYTRRFTAIVEPEADRIREAAGRVLGGESLNQIAVDFEARGVPTPSGRAKGWSAETLRGILAHPRMVGSRVYDNAIVARDCWPAILDDDTYARVCLVFADRTRRHREPDRALLCGLMVCDACGKEMMATQRTRDREWRYVCQSRSPGLQTVIMAPTLEAWITNAVLDRISWREGHPDVGDTIDEREEAAHTELIIESARHLEEMGRRYAAGAVSADVFHATRRSVARTVETERRHRQPGWRAAVLAGRTAADLRAGWEQFTIGERALIVRSELDHLRIKKADPAMIFDSARVVPLWWETLPVRPPRICQRRIINSGRRLLNCHEVAARLGQTERDVQRSVRQGLLVPAATEPALLFRAAVVDAFVDRSRVQPLARASKPTRTPRP